MKVLIYGAGVVGSIYAVRLHEAGVDVTLVARGTRLAAIRQHGVLVAGGDNGAVRSVPVPVVDHPSGDWDLIVVIVRSHQVDVVLESVAGLGGDVLFLVNWAAGPGPLADGIGRDRVLLGFPNQGGVMDGDIVRYRLESAMTRLVPMPIGEPDGRTTPRLERIIALFRGAGFRVTTESQMDAWLHTHAAFEVPLSRAVHVAGDPGALSTDGVAVRSMVRDIRRSLATMPNPTVPGAFRLLSVLPEGLLARVFASFLRSSAAGPLRTDSAAVSGELDTLDDQLRASALGGAGRLEK